MLLLSAWLELHLTTILFTSLARTVVWPPLIAKASREYRFLSFFSFFSWAYCHSEINLDPSSEREEGEKGIWWSTIMGITIFNVRSSSIPVQSLNLSCICCVTLEMKLIFLPARGWTEKENTNKANVDTCICLR